MRRLHAAPRTWLFSEVGDAALFEECVRSLKNNKAPGPDGIPNEVLKGLPPPGRAAVHGIFQLMWAAAYTPAILKQTHTVLMHKKGPVTDLGNYRRLGLENTLLKLWTKLITAAMAHKAETSNMLRATQAGFRQKRSTERQLEMLTMALEDARLTKQDIFLLLIDFSEAFDTTNHDKMLWIMYDLGYGTDAVEVVRDLYTGVTTQVRTPFGLTPEIMVDRGAIQGDSLSPFLFIVYLEPLLRWLTHGERGYKPGCLKKRDGGPSKAAIKHALPACAYADALNIITSTAPDMMVQAEKVEKYAGWADMRIITNKTKITGALYRTNPNPYNMTMLEARLKLIELGNKTVEVSKPTKPFKFIGVEMTMDLKWSEQKKAVIKMIKSKGQALKTSLLSHWRKAHILNTVIKPAVD